MKAAIKTMRGDYCYTCIVMWCKPFLFSQGAMVSSLSPLSFSQTDMFQCPYHTVGVTDGCRIFLLKIPTVPLTQTFKFSNSNVVTGGGYAEVMDTEG